MLKRFLIAGALVWLPIIATVWVIRLVVSLFDQLMAMLPTEYQPDSWFGVHIPGLGIVIAAIVVLVTGALVTNFLGNKIIGWLDSALKHIPFIGSLYSTIKQVLQTIMSSEGQSFRKALLVEYPKAGIWSIAFQTSDAEESINQQTGQTMVTAFVPTTPNPTSGFLILVPKETTKVLDMSVEEAFKLVVSLGTLKGLPDAKHIK